MMRTLFAASLDIDVENWLKEWGLTVQIVGGIVLVLGIAALVALRRKRKKSSKNGAGSEPPSPPHQPEA